MADINGTAGADLLFGASAGDLITGGDDRDALYGGAGDDILLGGDGDDTLRGEAGNDRLEGGAGNDSLTSTDQGNDTLIGGEGNDYLFVDRSRTGDSLVLDGGTGNDRLVVQLRQVTGIDASAGEGDDSIDVFMLRNGFTLSLGSGRDVVNLYNFRGNIQSGARIVISDFEAGETGDRINFSNLHNLDFTGWNPATNPFAAGYLKAVQSGSNVIVSARLTTTGSYFEAIVLSNVLLSSLTPGNLGGWTIDGSPVPPVLLVGTGAGELLRGNGGADDIEGLDGDDILEGHAGADSLKGGDGNDIIRGGVGDDQIYGGLGNDNLNSGGDNDSLYGEDGNDSLALTDPFGIAPTSLFGSGGAGHDNVTISGGGTGTSFTVDAGSGEDVVTISSLLGSATIALGEGRDRLDIDNFTKSATSGATIEIVDFATGDGGDRLQWTGFLLRTLTGMSGPDLFATGHLRLLQSGSDVLFQIDRDGGGDQFVTLIDFRNTDAAAFTAYNLGGFAPGGAAVAGSTITGTGDPDRLFGTDGDDVIEGGDGQDFLLGNHGDDFIRGGAGDDLISGYDGDDVLEGGDGNDSFNSGRGDDAVDGGEGNDILNDGGSGSKAFDGGAGADSVYFTRVNSQDMLIATGGDGNDYFSVRISGYLGGFEIDGAAGDDYFDVAGNGGVTLGEGVDFVRFVDSGGAGPGVLIHDFVAGDLGDRMDFGALVGRFTDFDPASNPFATGHLRLIGSTYGTALAVDFDGHSGSGNPVAVATLSGVEKLSLTSHNIGGYALPFTIGTSAAETFQGSVLSDEFVGGGGEDTFLIGYGGDDKAIGGTGNDLFFAAVGISGPAPRSVSITGGGGTDTLQVQSQLSDYLLTLRPNGAFSYNAIDATGIGKVEFLSGFDSSRGFAPNIALQYYITIEDGFSAPGAPLLLDTTRLASSEGFYMHAENIKDQDVFLRLAGGIGTDHIHAGAGGSWLDGGGGDDEFYTGLGDDTLLGGDGSDNLNADVGYNRSGTDLLDGGEGNDVLELAAGDQGSWTSVTILGGGGNDYLFVNVQGGISPGVATIDLGTGNDRLKLQAATGTYNVTLGAGSDQVEIVNHRFYGINAMAGANKSITISDFDPGPGGDTLQWATALNAYLSAGYVAFQNPFRTGHARLLQDGSDVLVQLSRLNDGSYVTLLRLQNHQVADFNAGIGGFVPVPINGTPEADVLTGTASGDIAYGLAQADVFRLEQGGTDYADGGDGDDVFYFGSEFNEDSVVGGAGADELVVQGYSSSRLAGLSGVETITLLTANDPRFGVKTISSGSGFFFTSADVNVAAGGLLTVDGAALPGAEKLVFNGSAELDGRFSITGGAGADQLTGGAGNDVLRGGEGIDKLIGGGGNDQLLGEGGDDVIEESGSGSDLLSGGEGDDQFTITRSAYSTDVVTASGGAGADRFTVSMTGSTLALDAGEGDDIVTLKGSAKVAVTLGSGKDTLDLSQFVRSAGIPEIMDFQAGADGDSIGWGSWISLNTSGWWGNGDPFQKGYLRLAQKGADVHLQINASGQGGVSGYYETFLVFRNVDKLSFTAANLGGFAPLSLSGTGAGETLAGSQGDDVIDAGGGNDLLLVHQGGTDILRGGEGDDVFFFGRRLPSSWQVGDSTGLLLDGGSGTDTVVLQGAYFYGWAVPTTGIERLKLLAGTDNIYGTGGSANTSQFINLRDSDIAAGTALTIDASGLLAAESMSLDARYESDAELVFLGGAGNDTITPGRGRTTIHAGAGNDWVDGTYGGANTVYGEAGNDMLHNSGNGLLDGGDGDDILTESNLGLDTVNGGSGNDIIRLRGNGNLQLTNATVSGGDGNDRIELNTYYPGSISIDGGAGTDTIDIIAAKGTITIALGEGSDVFNINNPTWIIRADTSLEITDFAAGAGRDRFDWAGILASGLVYQPGSNPFLTGHARVVQSGNDILLQLDPDGFSPNHGFATYVTLKNVSLASLTPFNLGFGAISGGNGNSNLVGTTGRDWIEGGTGDDSLDGGAGADTMWGGQGNDVYFLDDAGDSVRELGGEGVDEVRTSLASYALAANVENLTATSGSAHDFRGNAGNNVVTGAGGNDFIRLQDGGNDTGIGGGGNDVFLFGSSLNGLDVVDGGAGIDQIALQGGGPFTFGASITGIESLGLLSGSDTRFGDLGGKSYSYDLTATDWTVAPGAQLTVDGAKLLAGENLTFNGSAETDGSFFIYGGRGIDQLTGGSKNDVFLFGSDGHFGASDVVNGGPGGTDQLALRGSYSLTFGANQLVGIESIGLLSAQDTRFGALGSNYSYNLTTHDNNVASGVQMTVDGAKLRGTETLVFNGSAETDGSFRIFGGLNGDSITGGQGADILQGHGGADMLTGGGGADTFRYASVSDSGNFGGIDRILDFTAGTDRIDLSRIDANSLIEGNQAFNWIGSQSFGNSAGELRAYRGGNGDWFVEGDVDGDGVADFVLNVIPQGTTPLGTGDFLL